MVEHLILNDADIDSQDAHGKTPLHHAAMLGRECSVDVLLENGANDTIRDKDGNSALLLATSRGQGRVVKKLLEYGSSYEVVNEDGSDAIKMAKQNNQTELVELLMANAHYTRRAKLRGHKDFALRFYTLEDEKKREEIENTENCVKEEIIFS
mmetsp:Transcript_9059/g.30193  ORF Transcript_9059/g.30193 Transcript_9059/m.30193 type:complete len:153 (-) Transcript_9059:1035-1493(-)